MEVAGGSAHHPHAKTTLGGRPEGIPDMGPPPDSSPGPLAASEVVAGSKSRPMRRSNQLAVRGLLAHRARHRFPRCRRPDCWMRRAQLGLVLVPRIT
jgi:hypothetical protein